MMLSKVVQPIWVCIREGMNENPLVIFFLMIIILMFRRNVSVLIVVCVFTHLSPFLTGFLLSIHHVFIEFTYY